MDHSLRRWQIGGFLFTGIAGTLLHFLYHWSGESSLLGAFSAVNESVWEHMKILFIPLFLTALVEMAVFGDRQRFFWRGKLIGILSGLLFIPLLHYGYTGALGLRLSWLDIALFYLAAALSFFLEYRLYRRSSHTAPALELGAMLLVWVLAFLFLLFTYAPPHLPIFLDPLTGTYGITR